MVRSGDCPEAGAPPSPKSEERDVMLQPKRGHLSRHEAQEAAFILHARKVSLVLGALLILIGAALAAGGAVTLRGAIAQTGVIAGGIALIRLATFGSHPVDPPHLANPAIREWS